MVWRAKRRRSYPPGGDYGGGKGTRLLPYSALFPKPLMPLGDTPVMELLLRRLKAAGVQEVILAVNHLRHLIQAYFGDGSDLGLRLHYSAEDKPLGTAGALGKCWSILDETFFLTNGDLLTTMDLSRMALTHCPRAPTRRSASLSGKTRSISD